MGMDEGLGMGDEGQERRAAYFPFFFSGSGRL